MTSLSPSRRIAASRLSPQVLAHEPTLVEWRRQLHTMPELGFEEHETGDFVCQRLADMGATIRTGVAKTGIVGIIEGSRPGPTLAFRADMDGLPIQEENPLPFASRNPGRMHACGHDGHTAVLLSVARLLSQCREHWAGRVVCFFQPAEEHPGGAKPMIEAGVLRDYRPEAILGLHLWNFLETGQVACHGGPLMAGSDVLEVRLRGKGGHGAYPHKASDLVLAAAQLISALHTIVGRDLDPLDSGVITIGQVQIGSAHNIFAEEALLRGSVRSLGPAVQDTLERRIREVCAGIALAFGVQAEVEYERLYPVTVNDHAVAELVRSAAEQVVGSEGLVRDGRTLAAEDMGYWLREVPGCYFFVGSANAAKGLTEPHHSPRFNIDEEALSIGCDILFRSALAFLQPRG